LEIVSAEDDDEDSEDDGEVMEELVAVGVQIGADGLNVAAAAAVLAQAGRGELVVDEADPDAAVKLAAVAALAALEADLLAGRRRSARTIEAAKAAAGAAPAAGGAAAAGSGGS
jgi:hypothetical protein